jgi:predicted nucleotidyltransferase
VDTPAATPLHEHHRRTIARLVDTFGDDPRFLALIIGGSVAKGRAAADSDVDILLVATDEEYARRAAADDVGYFNQDLCDYPGGYIDGKVIDQAFLTDVAERGSEPARAAFVGAFPAYSRLPDLPALLARIPVYPEHEQQARIRSFWGEVLILNWYVGEAEKRHDAYLLAHVAADLVLFGGRLILAHNKILYPYHKWFMYEVRRAPHKPADFVALAEALLAQPDKARAQALCDSLTATYGGGISLHEAGALFMRDAEWSWRTGRLSPADW